MTIDVTVTTSKTLLALLNAHRAKIGKSQLAKWGGKRVDLEAAVSAILPKDEPKTKKAPKEKKTSETSDRGAIQRFVYAKLLEVVGEDEDGRPVGHTYPAILEAVKAEFPEAATSIACLRWYATKLNGSHRTTKGSAVVMPHRPKAPRTTDEASVA